MALINIHIHHHDKEAIAALEQKLDFLTLKTEQIMTTVAEIKAELDNVVASLAEERVQIKAKLDEQSAKIDELLAGGGTEEERAALLQQVKDINADIKSIIPDTPAPTE